LFPIPVSAFVIREGAHTKKKGETMKLNFKNVTCRCLPESTEKYDFNLDELLLEIDEPKITETPKFKTYCMDNSKIENTSIYADLLPIRDQNKLLSLGGITPSEVCVPIKVDEHGYIIPSNSIPKSVLLEWIEAHEINIADQWVEKDNTTSPVKFTKLMDTQYLKKFIDEWRG
jgi:hypothetical protein